MDLAPREAGEKHKDKEIDTKRERAREVDEESVNNREGRAKIAGL